MADCCTRKITLPNTNERILYYQVQLTIISCTFVISKSEKKVCVEQLVYQTKRSGINITKFAWDIQRE